MRLLTAGLSLALVGCALPRAALWDVVDRHCLRDSYDQSVCPKRAPGYVLVKTYQRPPHFLLVPSVQVSGIEAPVFWVPGPDNYFRAAWRERDYAAAFLGGGVPPARVGIAINSAFGRSQDQLHVHINCVRPQVLAELRHSQLSEQWQELRLASVGQVYRARRLPGNDLPEDPFAGLAQAYPQLTGHGELQTAFAASVDFDDVGPRAVVLESEFHGGDRAFPGHAEYLLSNHCE